jgi:type VI secretion system protein ImpG
VHDDLKRYYEAELSYIRQVGAEFAQKHTAIARRLLLGDAESRDPHVERLVEAFAFLAARIHLKIDDDFPEITHSMLNVLYPHYLRPVPSMSVVEFNVDPEQGKLTSATKIPRNSLLYSRLPVDGIVQCNFRTCYDATIAPIRISQAKWTAPQLLKPSLKAPEAAAACSIELSCFPDVQFKALGLNSLTLYLNGERNPILSLYELLFNSCIRIVARNPNDPSQRVIELPRNSLRTMGFREEESVLQYPRRSFTGYRILQEYFAFPEKFFFAELSNLDVLSSEGFTDRAEIIFLIAPFEPKERQQSLELSVSEKTFRLGCTPIVNLFSRTAEPILLDQTRYEYLVIPNVRRRTAYEISSIDEVRATTADRKDVIPYEPFYSGRHGRAGHVQTYWNAVRRASSGANDPGTEMYISLVDTSGEAARTGGETLAIHCTCTNRDLPSRLPFGSEAGDFELEGGAPVKRIVALMKPTDTIRPPLRKGLNWRLISQLSLNYLSLVEEGRGALQDILRLYNFSESRSLDQQIASITSLTSRKHFARVVSDHGVSFARGVQVEMEFDEELYAGRVFLFASILEYFL